ncbi:maleylpyruvate isomerase N-terminal domain-containing protein [Nocardioides sp. GXZ039]|uniref:maleylpyruvate isomerase N-terminal domain-containing protein n=1 Tax=Nocardioides sp. GXZ039 TaxID=3136018 RepID=UPI0030F429E8
MTRTATSRTREDALGWARTGTDLVLARATGLTDTDVAADSTLPGWTVGQVLGHVAANAVALTNLATWAATGVETPMYPSVQARDADLAAARERSAAELVSAIAATAEALALALARLDDEQWTHQVRTIQGRRLPASEIPWLRARETCVHAVDLGASFTDLPADFLAALVDDICVKRGLDVGALPAGGDAEVAAWLAGRDHGLVDAPEIGPWL